MKQKLINHVCFAIDCSSSMTTLSKKVVEVFDNIIKQLAEDSQKFDQETRVSIYFFADNVNNFIFDLDVLRLPSLAGSYKSWGSTSLISAAIISIEDLKQTFAKYGDHAFILYVLTDGEENSSFRVYQHENKQLVDLLATLPDNWTVAAMVPDKRGRQYCINFGFPEDNILIWETTGAGLEKVRQSTQQASTNFMAARAKGQRSVKNLFAMDMGGVKVKDVKASGLKELKKYDIFKVTKDEAIRPFVERHTGDYQIGSCYYQLMKKETIQTHKQLLVRNKKSGKMYGGANARSLLGLPDRDVRVEPVNAEWDIFVQSTSVNRKLIGGTELVVMAGVLC